MKTLAFYSYKGGVGRTLAVGHVAYWLSKLGKKVFMMDLDLEAPGLHYKLDQYSEQPVPVKGLVDYLGYFMKALRPAPSLEEYTIKLTTKELEMSDMWLMPAGDPFARSYWRQLSEIDWKEFLYGDSNVGMLLFLELKLQIEKQYAPDFLLIDSRTGLTDLTGVGLDLLGDDAIVFGVNNAENIDGARLVMERLRDREKLPFKEEKTKLHFVLTRIPAPQNQAQLDRETAIKSKVLERLNAGSGLASGPLVTKINLVHIDPGQAIEERNRMVEKNPEKYPIVKDYINLVFETTGLGKSEAVDFWETWEKYEVAEDQITKENLARKLVAMKSNFAAQEFERGYIAQVFLKEFQLAMDAYDNTIRLQPDDADAYINRGVAKAELQRFSEAIADFDKAIALNPEYANAYYNRGIGKSDLQQFPEAIADYDKAIAFNPEYADAYYNRGNAKSDLQQFSEAIADYDQAIALNAENANAYNNRGVAKAELQQFPEALADYDKAIALNPECAGAYNNRGNAKRILGKYEEAMIDVLQSIKLDPNNGHARGTLADLHSDMGNHDLFYESLQNALHLDPSLMSELDTTTVARHQHEARFQALQKRYAPE